MHTGETPHVANAGSEEDVGPYCELVGLLEDKGRAAVLCDSPGLLAYALPPGEVGRGKGREEEIKREGGRESESERGRRGGRGREVGSKR